MSTSKEASGPWYQERPIRIPNEGALSNKVAGEMLSLSCLGEFKKRLERGDCMGYFLRLLPDLEP